MTTSYADHASRGNALGALRMALINGALWASAISWSNAIHEVTRTVLPEGTMNVVLAELLAASITTFFGVTISLLVARRWCAKPPPPALPRVAKRSSLP